MKHTITAYVFDKGFSGMPADDAKKITHVNYSFALIKGGKADVSHWRNEDKLLRLMKEAPNLSFNLSVGGWGADGFSQATATADGRELLAESLVELVQKYQFRGVDLDWEYPADSIGGIASSPDDVRNFPIFIHILRQKLDILKSKTGNSYLLTLAAGCTQRCIDNLSCSKIVKDIDQINLMTYDLAPWGKEDPTSHHTGLFPGTHPIASICGASATEAFHKAGIPMDKIVLGAAFYGRMHTGVEHGDKGGLYQAHESEFPDAIKYSEIKERLRKGAIRYWDDMVKAPYLYDEKDKLFATYDDCESLHYKTEYVRKNGLAGIMFWEYCCEGTEELLVAIYRGIR